MIETVQEIFERFVFDPSLIDLVVWYPYLDWSELMTATATVLAWKFVMDRIERMVAYRVRRLVALGLLRLAFVIRPSVS
jgi:hypothetical protein